MLYLKSGCCLTAFGNGQNLYILYDNNFESYSHRHYLVIEQNGNKNKVWYSEGSNEKESFNKIKKIYDDIVGTLIIEDTINRNVVIDLKKYD